MPIATDDPAQALADKLFQPQDAGDTDTSDTDVDNSADDTSTTDDAAADADASDDGGDTGDDQDGQGVAADEDAAWLAEIGQRHGYDLTKFKDRDAAMGGLINLAKKLSGRDEEAQIGRKLMAAIGDRYEEFVDWASNRQTAQPAAVQQDADEPDFSQVSPKALRKIIDAGRADGATSQEKRRAEAANEFLLDRMLAMATNPTEYLRQYGIDPEAQQQTIQQQMAEREAYLSQQHWIQRHGAEIYRNPNDLEQGYTHLGAKAAEIAKRMMARGAPNDVGLWEEALGLARELMPKATQRKAPAGAKHRAEPATTPARNAKTKTLTDKLRDVQNEDKQVEIAVEHFVDSLFPDEE